MYKQIPDPLKPPRIAYVTSSRGFGGAEHLIRALVVEGGQRGFELMVLNPFADTTMFVPADHFPGARCDVRECSSIRQLPGLRLWLGRRLAEFEPDIVHVTLFHAGVLTATLARRPGERRILTNVYGEGVHQLSYAPARVALDRWAGRRFDHVVGISDSVVDFLKTTYGYPPPPVSRIRLGWEGDPLPPNQSPRDPTIVCVAMLRREKGHDTLLAAFEAVRRQIPNARLVLVGDGPYRPEVEARIQSAGLKGSVHLAGFTTDVWPHLANADVFALASHTEAFGIVIAEAFAAGLPVVASNVGGIPELVTRGVTGELFEPGDHEALASKLVSVIQSPRNRLAEMIAAGREAAQKLHMRQTVAANLDLYSKLLDRSLPEPV